MPAAAYILLGTGSRVGRSGCALRLPGGDYRNRALDDGRLVANLPQGYPLELPQCLTGPNEFHPAFRS